MGALIKQKGDMKNDYPDLYLTALQKMEEFQRHIMDDALWDFIPRPVAGGFFYTGLGFL